MTVHIEKTAHKIRVSSPIYAWEWDSETDIFSLSDSNGRLVLKGPHQPLVVTTQSKADQFSLGRGRAAVVKPGLVRLHYSGINRADSITVTWNFQPDFITLEPLEFTFASPSDIVKVVYFAKPLESPAREGYAPSLYSHYAVVPGLCMTPSVSPVVDLHASLALTTVLGSGAMRGPGLAQQWGLPAHYFCNFNTSDQWNARGARKLQSDAVCWGLRELPQGDYRLEFRGIGFSPVLNLRSDLWKQIDTTGPVKLGLHFILTFGSTFSEAIRSYYTILMREKIITQKNIPPGSRKNQVLLSPQYNTWGAECALGIRPTEFNEDLLVDFIHKFQQSGMRAGTFVIDDKWEDRYGQLAHDPVRFPHFEEHLRQLRAQGYFIGLWAAFLRCQDPASLGLDESNLLQTKDGHTLWLSHQADRYGIFDVSQPRVQQVLGKRARDFIRRYDPDLIKFDFGYELPSLDVAAPADKTWAGERLLQKGLEVVVGAMRAEKPDLVIMYYGLSPLLLQYYDLHSVDDLVYCPGDYDLETNRRIFFSSLCGELGLPTYGSSGYDWASSQDIWFDSAPSGSLGSLQSFDGDENGDLPQPEWIARFNGLAAILRPSPVFSIRPLDAVWQGGYRAAFSPSWERSEGGRVVMLALRPNRWDGKPSAQIYDLVTELDVKVVVASLTDDSILESGHLGMVPFGDGHCVLKHAPTLTGKQAVRVIEHFLEGSTLQYLLDCMDGIIRLEFKQARNQQTLEWLELIF